MGASTTITSQGGLPSLGIGNATVEKLFIGGSPGASSLTLGITQSGELANRLLRFKIGGRLQMGTTGTFQLRFYAGTAILSANKFFDTNAITCTGNGNFLVLIDTFWDALSKSFGGAGYGQMLNTAIGITQLVNAVTSDPNGALATPVQSYTQQFVVSGQFGSSNTSNTAFIDLFEVDT